MLNYDLEECKYKIRSFIKEKLDNNIENLREFDFQLMINNPQNYDGYCGSSDCDDTELAKAIYCVLWHDKINELSPVKIGTGRDFRGDCINTLAAAISRQVVDKLCEESNNMDIEIGNSIQISKESKLAKKINKMILFYHTYGNFICIPNKCGKIVIDRRGPNTEGSIMKETFNIYRGSYTRVLKYRQYNNAHWGKVTYADNFYIFLKELGICFEKIFNNIDNKADVYLLDIFNENKEFFKLFKDESGNPEFAYFYDLYYLDKNYIDEKGNEFEMLRWGELNKNIITNEKYIKLLEKYLDYCIDFITKRTKLMECKLKKELGVKVQ